ncbi:hypothetical protein JKF63_04566 [Porcisia hertigi]|uniref:Uncharacterized protein n=1 Tax=Porcisia hertigi TaxID=2761500 RepID=A0A836ITK1_9TRYP|nr:hypothetical protein JKF63_04566 [Porcisia hertigi]
MSSAAARQLQRLLDGYVSASLDGQERKLVPNGNGAHTSSSHTLALDAAELIRCLPFFSTILGATGGGAASRRALPLSPLQGLMGATDSITHLSLDGAGASDALSPLILYLGDVVERHLHAFMSAISLGPPFTTLRSAAELRRGGASDGSGHMENGVRDDHSASECGHHSSGGPYVNFIAWVALEAYRLLLRGAESRQRERRAAGGPMSVDAGVRTDAYVRWEREVGERVSAAVAATNPFQTTCPGGTDEICHDFLRDIFSATDAQLDDVFATYPHFFYTVMCTEILPGIQQCVHSRDGQRLAWLRQALRSDEATERTNEECPGLPTWCFSSTFWADAVSLLCCGSTSPGGFNTAERTTRNDGGLAPAATLPSQTSAFVAAALASSLAVPLLRPACHWIDRFASLTSTTEAHPPCHPGGTEKESSPQAIAHILDVCMRAVQVIPFPMCDGCDSDMSLSLGSSEMAGDWLIPSTSSPLKVRSMPFLGLRRQRRAVVLPGLSIAATHIRSLAAVSAGKKSANDVATSDVSAPAGTCVWSPAGALAQASWTEAQLSSSAVAPCCNDVNAPFTSVSAVPGSRLYPVELLLLFEDMPCDEASLGRLRAALDVEVREGWVLLVVQASVSKATQQCVEATWGTEARPVLLLSAVGRWGLQQLALRFNVQPNTSATDARHLRWVRRRLGSDSDDDQSHGPRGCGVAALLLRGQQYAPSSALSADCGAQHQQRGEGHPRRMRYAPDFLEVREHYLFVVGESADAVDPSTRSAPVEGVLGCTAGTVTNPALATVFESQPTSSHLQRCPPSPPPMYPPTTSMRFRDESEESSSSEVSSRSSPNSPSGGGSTFSDTTAAAIMAAGAAGEGVISEWYGDPAVPPIPFVVASVMVGAATRGAQQELLYNIGYHWRLLLHQLILPEPLCCRVRTSGERGAAAMAIRKLGSLLQPPLRHACGCASPARIEEVYTPEQLRALDALREALLSYELLSLQHGPEGRSLDELWRVLQRYTEPSTGLDEEYCEPPPESWLTVQSAYLAMADCLDELCRTVVLGQGGGDASAIHAGSRGASTRGLYFFPVI